MYAVIATDSISLFGEVLFTFECPPDIFINRSRPVHEATGGHAVRGNYCIHYHVWANFADNRLNLPIVVQTLRLHSPYLATG